jgi:hypothetical protein
MRQLSESRDRWLKRVRSPCQSGTEAGFQRYVVDFHDRWDNHDMVIDGAVRRETMV